MDHESTGVRIIATNPILDRTIVDPLRGQRWVIQRGFVRSLFNRKTPHIMKKLKRITIQIDVRDIEDMTKVFWKIVGNMAKNGTETAEISIDSANVVFHMGYIEKSMKWTEKTIDGQTCRIYQSRMDD
jgi:hypothetical protein